MVSDATFKDDKLLKAVDGVHTKFTVCIRMVVCAVHAAFMYTAPPSSHVWIRCGGGAPRRLLYSLLSPHLGSCIKNQILFHFILWRAAQGKDVKYFNTIKITKTRCQRTGKCVPPSVDQSYGGSNANAGIPM